MTAMPATGEVRNLHVSVSRVSVGRPFTWLSQGWMDMRRNWGASLGYGGLIVGLGWTVLIFCGTHPYYVAAAFSGFLLGAPIISAGFAEMSRRYEAGEQATFDDSLAAFARRPGSLFAFGAILALCAVIWFAVSAVMLDTVFHVAAPSMRETLYRGFIDQMNRDQVEAYFAVGGSLAALVFVLSVVSVPLIIDKGATPGRAMATSLHAAFSNIPAMVVWSGLILVLTVIGYAPLLFGLVIIGPLLGHATWHAYKDMIR
jgi:uncharacterized membrane protein